MKNRDRNHLLQSLLESATEVYYKVRQVLGSVSCFAKCKRLLLQSAPGLTKCDSYYKVRHNRIRNKN